MANVKLFLTRPKGALYNGIGDDILKFVMQSNCCSWLINRGRQTEGIYISRVTQIKNGRTAHALGK